jgi:pimeloyl-ACP methyl ester carboxylesterase
MHGRDNAGIEGYAMPSARVNDDIRLWYDVAGTSDDAVVLVHGSWADHASWQPVIPGLARSFQVVTYDRRGHGLSESAPGQSTRQQDEADLAGLIEGLDLAPVHVVGNSFGGSIVLGLAATRPDLFRSVVVHEPPLSAMVSEDPEMQPVLSDFQSKIDAVLRRLRMGDLEAGSRQFMEEVAIGPGAWDAATPEVRQGFRANALTWVDEQQDPGWSELDVHRLSRLACPALLTQGGQSFPWFPRIIAKLQQAVPNARVHTFPAAGHVPHLTHPQQYVRVTAQFLAA